MIVFWMTIFLLIGEKKKEAAKYESKFDSVGGAPNHGPVCSEKVLYTIDLELECVYDAFKQKYIEDRYIQT